MITKITCLSDYICFFEKEKFELKPITLLVGDQGCGKSTLLDISKHCAMKSGEHIHFEMETDDTIQDRCLHLDMEKNNPGIEDANPDDSQDMMYKLLSKWNSHGETLFPLLQEIESCENVIILLDEPETALSLRSQYKMIEIFKKCLENNCQIIIATHNLVFMEAFPDNILSLEHMKYVTPEQFIKLEKKPNSSKEKRQDKEIKKMSCKEGINCECVETMSRYDNNCVHYVDREGKSGYNRSGHGFNAKREKGSFKNG